MFHRIQFTSLKEWISLDHSRTTVYDMKMDLYIPGDERLLLAIGSALVTLDINTAVHEPVVGVINQTGYNEGVGSNALFYKIFGFEYYNSTNVLVSDHYNSMVRLVTREHNSTMKLIGGRNCRDIPAGSFSDLCILKPRTIIRFSPKQFYLVSERKVLLLDFITENVTQVIPNFKPHLCKLDPLQSNLYCLNYDKLLTYSIDNDTYSYDDDSLEADGMLRDHYPYAAILFSDSFTFLICEDHQKTLKIVSIQRRDRQYIYQSADNSFLEFTAKSSGKECFSLYQWNSTTIFVGYEGKINILTGRH